ncbi:hypothetical protein ACFZAM_03020 [Streptomyces sp. NPDC008079]|uniref:hypothetical protein n=1 Tax=Streptomyces sp. NPDC008079 TaxID=3364806 RepID=UPI0036E61957
MSDTVQTLRPLPANSLTFSATGHTNPEQLLGLLTDADARRGSTGLAYLAEHTRAADLIPTSAGPNHGKLPYAVRTAPATPSELVASATSVVTQAVTASLARLKTNPNDVSKQLHRSIDNAQGWHLAEVGGQEETEAYASSRFSSAVDAMADALGATENQDVMARGLRTALDMVISEKDQPITRAEVEIADLSEGTAALYKQYGDTLKVALPPVHDLDQVKTAISLFVSPEAAALITPPCFAGDAPLGSDHPDAKAEAIEMAILAADAKGPVLSFLATAWAEARRSRPADVRDLADAIDHNLKATAALPTRQQLAYVPPTDAEQAAAITLGGERGARGAILEAYLFAPEWEGNPDGPMCLSVYSEPSADDDLDLDGANKLIADLEALLPKLRVMRDVLAEQDKQAQA